MSTTVEQEAPAPAAELAGLGFFTGSWQAEGTFHATPFSSQKPIRMSIEASIVHRGFWIQTRTAEHPSTGGPSPLTATCLWGYDTGTGRFSAEWFGSNGGRATQTSAGWDDDRLVFTGRMTYGGCSFLLRDTFSRRCDDEYHHLGEVYLGQGWVPVAEELVRRLRCE
jgi:hypothetical protein